MGLWLYTSHVNSHFVCNLQSWGYVCRTCKCSQASPFQNWRCLSQLAGNKYSRFVQVRTNWTTLFHFSISSSSATILTRLPLQLHMWKLGYLTSSWFGFWGYELWSGEISTNCIQVQFSYATLGGFTNWIDNWWSLDHSLTTQQFSSQPSRRAQENSMKPSVRLLIQSSERTIDKKWSCSTLNFWDGGLIFSLRLLLRNDSSKLLPMLIHADWLLLIYDIGHVK